MTRLSELKALLREEGKLIIAGDFVALAELAQRKSKMTAVLNNAGATVDELREIRALSDRNDKLLIASRMGLEAGVRRIKDIMGAAEHATYGTDGSKTSIRARQATLQRKL